MSHLVEFAENELNRILKTCENSEDLKMQKAINDNILDIVKKFSEQGHTGFTANYSLNILKRLLDWKPISVLTGEDDEWVELNYTPDTAYQNKRCPSIFKDADGRAYNVEGKVFSDDNGHTWFTGSDSRVYIDFPYEVPEKPKYIIINNKIERDNILGQIGNAIGSIGGMVDMMQFNEETLLSSILPIHQFGTLEKKLCDMYYITKPLFSLQDDEQIRMWSVVNLVMKSDKEVPEKAND